MKSIKFVPMDIEAMFNACTFVQSRLTPGLDPRLDEVVVKLAVVRESFTPEETQQVALEVTRMILASLEKLKAKRDGGEQDEQVDRALRVAIVGEQVRRELRSE